MDKIKIIFLGTSQAIPTAARNHTSILLQYKNENMLFDCGEGTQRQFRKVKINMGKITRLFISHWHGDHILGLPGLLQTLALSNYSKTLYVYGPRGTRKFMDLMLRIFVYVGKIKVEIREVNEIGNGKILETSDFEIHAEKMEHGAPCLAYSFVEKDKIRINKKKLREFKIKNSPLLARLKEGKDVFINNRKLRAIELTYRAKGRKISIIMDTKINSGIEKLAKNSDLMICEATYLENSENGKKLASEYKHLTAKQAGEIARKAGAKMLVLTHLSQRYEHKEKLILEEAKKVFKNSRIAEDLMRIDL